MKIGCNEIFNSSRTCFQFPVLWNHGSASAHKIGYYELQHRHDNRWYADMWTIHYDAPKESTNI